MDFYEMKKGCEDKLEFIGYVVMKAGSECLFGHDVVEVLTADLSAIG